MITRLLFALLLLNTCLFAQLNVPEAEFEYAQWIPMPTTQGWHFVNPENMEPMDTLFYEDIDFRSQDPESFLLKYKNHWGIYMPYDDFKLLEFVYDSIVPISFESYLLKKGDTWSFYDLSGREKVIEMDSFYVSTHGVYLYKNGLVGFMDDWGGLIPPAYTAIHPFELRRVGMMEAKYTGLNFVVDGAYFNLVDSVGKKILPEGVTEIQEDDFEFVRFFDGNWHYLNLATREIIHSGNRVLIPFAVNVYKLYTEDHSRATLHLKGHVLNAQDDYFYLDEEYLVARSGQKVGLMNHAGRWLIPPRYDRIERVYGGASDELFRFYQGDACGLMDRRGVEFIPAHYAQIEATANPDRFIVFNDLKCGMVTKTDQPILPVKYEYLQLIDEYIETQLNQKFGIASVAGKELMPPEYKNMYYLPLSFDERTVILILGLTFRDTWQIAGKNGLISEKEYTNYQYGGNNFKGYIGNDIEVYSFDEKGEVEMFQQFSGLPILKSGKEKEHFFRGDRGWQNSYLEESQLTGLYGLRFFQKQGIAVEPKYTRVRVDRFGNFLCPETDELSDPLVGSIRMHVNQSFSTMFPATASEHPTALIQSTAYLKGSFWSYQALGTTRNGNDIFLTDDVKSPFKIEKNGATPWKYMENTGQVLKYFKGNPQICPIAQAHMSLYDFYQYRNTLDNVRLSPEDLAMVMNPALGVRFGEGELWGVNHEWHGRQRSIVMNPHRKFHELKEWPDLNLIYHREVGKDYGTLQETHWDEDAKPAAISKIKQVKYHDLRFLNFFELEKDSAIFRSVHPEFPGFEFEADSLNLAYQCGRIIGLDEFGGYVLRTPLEEIIARGALINYLGNGWFGVMENGKWQVIDRKGQPVIEGFFDAVSTWQQNELSLQREGFTIFLDEEGRELRRQQYPTKRISEHLLQEDRPEGRVLRNTLSGREYVLDRDATVLANGWIMQKTESGVYHVRNTFSGAESTVKADREPEALADKLVRKYKKALWLVDTNLEELPMKKCEGYDLFDNGILLMRTKKGKNLYNADGKLLLAQSTGTFALEGKWLLVNQRDTSFYLDSEGQRFTYAEVKKSQIEAQQVVVERKKTPYEVVQYNNLWGIQENGRWVIAPKYNWIQEDADGNYKVSYLFSQHLVNADLEVIFRGQFDEIQPLGGEYLLLRKDDQYWAITRDGDPVYHCRVRVK